MSRMCLLALVVLAAAGSTEAVWQQVEIEAIGTKLAQDCGIYIRWLDGESRPPNSDFGNGVCLGLVRGVFDTSVSSSGMVLTVPSTYSLRAPAPSSEAGVLAQAATAP